VLDDQPRGIVTGVEGEGAHGFALALKKQLRKR